MSTIKFHRKTDEKHEFTNGISRIPVLAGEYEDVQIFKYVLKAGAEWSTELYAEEDRCQMLLFIDGSGYIAVPDRAFNIEEVSVFIPNFDAEPFHVKAGTDLVFIQIIAQMSDYDRENMSDSRIELPRFRPVSQAWTYVEDFKTPGMKSYTLIEHRYLGRLSMGAVYGTGPSVVGQHIHNELEQWYIALPGASFTYQADGQEIPFDECDISYTPHGTYHGISAKPGQKFNYVWFELCEDGYPGQLK